MRDATQFGGAATFPGFTLWWDRWNGDGWCWRERTDSTFRFSGEDITEGRKYRSKMAARAAIRQELSRRQVEEMATAAPLDGR